MMTVLGILLKVTALLGFALMAVRLARRCRASLRHMVLTATFVLALAVPFTTFFGPTIPVTIPQGLTETVLERQSPDGAAVPVPASGGGATALRTDDVPSPVVSWLPWLLTIWLIGVAAFVSPVLVGALRVRALRRSSLPWPETRTFRDAVDVARGRRTRRDVVLRLHESVRGPITCGVLCPIVVLPADARTWAAEDIERALIHEFEHIRRHDWLTQRIARVVCAIYWFHPLIWMAWHALTLEAEHACDDAVVSRGDAPAYAEQLLRLAERQAAIGRQGALLAMTGRHDLARRIRALLDHRQQRGRVGAFTALLLVLGVMAVAAASSPILLVPSHQVEKPALGVPPPSIRGAGTRVEVRRPKPTLPEAPTTALAGQPQPARSQESRFSVNYNTNYLAENGLLAESDEDFIKHAVRLGAIVMQAGKLATAKTSNPEVKAFAQRLVNDHTAAAKELVQWAARKNVVLKDDDPAVKIKLDRRASLQTKTGADFDREFVAAMMGDETDAIVLFTNEWRTSKDPELSAFAHRTLPTLRGHMNVARPLRAKLF